MSMKDLRTDREIDRFEAMLLNASGKTHSFVATTRMRLPRSAIALAVALIMISSTAGAMVLLSRQVVFRGFTEVQHLIVQPFDHVINDGGPSQVNFLNGTSSGFNLSVLNRWRGTIAYNLSFDLRVSYVAIVAISGVLVQYNVNPQTGNLADGASYPIAWTLIPDNHAVGLSPTFFAQALVNDAGEQVFRADITLTFNLTSQFADGMYILTIAAQAP